MIRRKKHGPDPHHDPERLLKRVVRQCREQYRLELDRDPWPHPGPKGNPDESLHAFARELVRTLDRPPDPDYSARTKAVVRKWFERGLSGRLLALVGQALLRELFPEHRTRKTRRKT